MKTTFYLIVYAIVLIVLMSNVEAKDEFVCPHDEEIRLMKKEVDDRVLREAADIDDQYHLDAVEEIKELAYECDMLRAEYMEESNNDEELENDSEDGQNID